MKPHKHAELIKQWADGAEIECKINGYWWHAKPPSWDLDYEYRIKPEEKQPVVRWLWAFKTISGWQSTSSFYTDSEVVNTKPERVKLEYTRTEFPE
jgi:hypothetical protein